MKRSLPLALGSVALFSSLVFSANSDTPPTSPRSNAPTLPPSGEITLTIISPHGEDVKTEFQQAFIAWHEKKYGLRLKIDWRDLGGTNDDLRFVTSEFKNKPDGIGIDLFFGGGDYPFYQMAEAGLLASYRPPAKILDPLAHDIGGLPLYDAKNFTWFGVATAGFGIAYNKEVLRRKGWPEPKTWLDLTDPRYCGWIASGDPRNSGSTHMMYELILQAYGWDKGWEVIYQMGANAREFHKSSASAVKDCTLGNTAYALAIDFYAFTQVEFVGKEHFGWIMPPEIAVMNPDGIAILKGAPQHEIAEHFLDFVLGEEGQKLWFLPRGHRNEKGEPDGPQRFNIARMCLRPDFYERYKDITSVTVNPFKLATVRFDAGKGTARQKLVDALIGATVIDTHEEAVAALNRAAERGKISANKRFHPLSLRPPITEPDALEMAKTQWNNSNFRNHQVIQWQQWARQKYSQDKQPR